MSSNGKLICLFGIDGSGKTLHADRLAQELLRAGYRTRRVSIKAHHLLAYPLYLVLSRSRRLGPHSTLPLRNRILRRFWLWFELGNLAIVAASRVLGPVRRGSIVVCDRYVLDSLVSFAHSLGMPELLTGGISRSALRLFPANTVLIYLKVSPEVASSRKQDEGLDPATAASYADAYERLLRWLNLRPVEVHTTHRPIEASQALIRAVVFQEQTELLSLSRKRKGRLLVAIIGPVGAGKSTVAKLLQRRLAAHDIRATIIGGVFNNDVSRILLQPFAGSGDRQSTLNTVLERRSDGMDFLLRFWVLVDILTSRILFRLKSALAANRSDVLLVEDWWAGALATYKHALRRTSAVRGGLVSRAIRGVEAIALVCDLVVSLEAGNGTLQARWNQRGSAPELLAYLASQREVVRDLVRKHPRALTIDTERNTPDSEAASAEDFIMKTLGFEVEGEDDRGGLSA